MFLGLALENTQNHQPANGLTIISPADHPAKVYVLPADEDAVIAAPINQN